MIWNIVKHLCLVSSLLLPITSAISVGKPHDSVQSLTASNFRPAIQEDAANGLWLLQFFAPWCGHCKKMAPMLDTVAPLVSPKLAIGKIDCDQEKELCKEFHIKGFPTLKYARDGKVQDFPFGRSQDDIVQFANRMHAPAVQPCDSLEDALQLATTDHGIVFCVFHPQVQEGENTHERLMSTRLTQVFAQSARMQQAVGTFCLLSPTTDVSTAFGLSEIPPQGFIAKVEAGGVPPKLLMASPDITTPQVLDFVHEYNVPLVATFGPHNFHAIGKKGKPLVIGAVDGSSFTQVKEMKQALLDYCIEGPFQIVEKYNFGWMNGKQWNKFLTQFNITTDDLPQVLVLNVPTKSYWHDSSFPNIGDFLQAVEDGTVQQKEAAPVANGRWSQMVQVYFDFYPWSVAVLVAVLVLFVLILLPAPEELRPPYPRQDQEGPPLQPQEESTAPTSSTGDDTVETKKEK